MPAGQPVQGILQIGHGNERFNIHRLGIGRHDVAGRPVVTVGRNTVPRKVEEHPVVLSNLPGHGLKKRAYLASTRIKQRLVHLKMLLLTQHLGQALCICDCGLQRDTFS